MRVSVLQRACVLAVVGVGLAGLIGCPDNVSQAFLDCEVEGYPCSLSEVPLEVLAAGEDLADQAKAMLEAGSTLADALALLQAQAGVVDAAAGRTGLRFRLQGGRHVLVLQPDALGTALDDSSSQALAGRAKGRIAAGSAPVAKHVAGESPQTKRALVLSPFQWQFLDTDDGAAVAGVLEITRGYEGNVTYLENTAQDSRAVGIQQFKGWDAYDVIHVTGHGTSICDSQRCVSVIHTGDSYSTAEDLLQITEAGVNTAHFVGDDGKYFVVSGDFFRQQYPGGLDNALIFFNGCRTIGARSQLDTSLADAVAGENSVFLGWTEVVHSPAAFDAALSFFLNLSDNGVTAQKAWDDLGTLQIDSYEKEGQQIDSTLLLHRPGDTDLRIREVVTLEYPELGMPLTDGIAVAAVGRANDGQVDSVPYQVLLEGIPQDQQDAAIVQVSVEGYSSTPSPASAGERIGETGWRLGGTFPYIDLNTSQTVTMVATLTLPEGGVSRQSVSVLLIASRQDHDDDDDDDDDGDEHVPERWSGTARSTLTLTGLDKVVTATVELEEVGYTPGQAFKRLRVTGGTMTWLLSGVTGPLDDRCSFVTGPVQVPIQPGDGEILINTSTGQYTMHGLTEGPEVQAAASCGDYAYVTEADGIWLAPIINAEGKFTNPAGGRISGDYTIGQHSFDWSFTRQGG